MELLDQARCSGAPTKATPGKSLRQSGPGAVKNFRLDYRSIHKELDRTGLCAGPVYMFNCCPLMDHVTVKINSKISAMILYELRRAKWPFSAHPDIFDANFVKSLFLNAVRLGVCATSRHKSERKPFFFCDRSATVHSRSSPRPRTWTGARSQDQDCTVLDRTGLFPGIPASDQPRTAPHKIL